MTAHRDLYSNKKLKVLHDAHKPMTRIRSGIALDKK